MVDIDFGVDGDLVWLKCGVDCIVCGYFYF